MAANGIGFTHRNVTGEGQGEDKDTASPAVAPDSKTLKAAAGLAVAAIQADEAKKPIQQYFPSDST